MRYAKIRKEDISNGPGIRVSIFVQGCDIHCKGCFNQQTWDFNGGEEFTNNTITNLLLLCNKSYIRGLSILGGEPFALPNFRDTLKLAKLFKESFPDKDVWVWSGHLFEELMNLPDFEYIDVLVDGRFEESLKDPNLYYKGSSNQRVIDVKKSLKQNKLVLYTK